MTSDDIATAELIARCNFVGGTAPELYEAVIRRWGPPTVDLAADSTNTLAPSFVSEQDNALAHHCNWSGLIGAGLGWLNPPPGDLTPWAAKCAAYHRTHGTRILMLHQACIDADWWWSYIQPHADVHVLVPRMNYEGFPYPLVISEFGVRGHQGRPTAIHTMHPWRWTEHLTLDNGTGGGV